MMTHTEEEKKVLKEYLQKLIGSPTPFAKQKSIFGSQTYPLWCEEWELIEMLKYLCYGKESYYLDPPANRLKGSINNLWSKEDIEKKIIEDLDAMTSVDQMVDYFVKRREHFNEGS